MKKILFVGGVFLLLCGCAQKRTVPEGYYPRYSRFVGYKEEVLTKAAGRPDSIYYDDYGRRYLVYNTFSLDKTFGRRRGYYCSTMFLTNAGLVKASFFDENKCVPERKAGTSTSLSGAF